MNKKFYFGMFAAATMLFATSCSNDELEAVQSGDGDQVTFSLGLEGGISTRAISDGKGADRLMYAVFDKEGKRISTIAKVDKETTFPAKETITLAKGQTYKVVFWAQDNDCQAYSVSDDMKVSIDYAAGNNDETRDAFFANVEFTVEGHTNIDVTLKRPFAQINVGVTNADYDAAVASGLKSILTSSVVVKNAATSIDLLTGNVSGETEVTYDFAATPKTASEILQVDLNGDKTISDDEKFNYLSMSYILVNNDEEGGAKKEVLNDVIFTFHPESGNDIVFSKGLNSVPVQRNWRTNIVGQILTGNIHFNIVIDPIYDGEFDFIENENGNEEKTFGVKASSGKQYQTLDEALKAGESDIQLAAGEYTLEQSFNHDVTITGVDKENVKVKTLKSIYGNQYENSLTLKNLTVDVPTGLVYNESAFAFMHRLKNFTMKNCNSTGRIRLNVENGLIDNCEFTVNINNGFDGYAIYYYGGNNSNVKVSNSTFNTVGKAIVLYNETAMVMNLDVENCTFASSYNNTDKAAIQMHTEGGISGTVNIANSTATGFLNVNGGLWNELNNNTKEKTTNFKVNVTYGEGSVSNGVYTIDSAEDLAGVEDILGAGYGPATIDIQSDITTTNIYNLHTQAATADLTINGNGKTITSSSNSIGDFTWDATGQIADMATVFATNGSTTLKVNDLTFTGTMSALQLGLYAPSTNRSGNIVMNNVTVKDAEVVELNQSLASGVIIYNKNTTLNNCVFKDTKLSNLETKTPVVSDVNFSRYSTTVVNGGEIGTALVWNTKDVYLTVENGAKIGTLTVKSHGSTKERPTINIKEGATVGILDLSDFDTNNRNMDEQKIQIAEGTVGKIVANGKEYDSIAEFNAR